MEQNNSMLRLYYADSKELSRIYPHHYGKIYLLLSHKRQGVHLGRTHESYTLKRFGNLQFLKDIITSIMHAQPSYPLLVYVCISGRGVLYGGCRLNVVRVEWEIWSMGYIESVKTGSESGVYGTCTRNG